MKLASLFAVGAFALSSTLALAASGVEEKSMDGMPGHEGMMNMDHDAMMKSHAEMQQKSTAASSEERKAKDAAPEKIKPEKDMSRHFHPRDGGK